MIPPERMDVTDRNGGFVAEGPVNTIWRGPRPSMMGTLVDYDEESFYQTNDNCTKARYRLYAYRFLALVWFDNKTGERVA